MMEKGETQNLGIFKHSLESRFIADLIMNTCVLWVILTFVFRNRSNSLIEDIAIQCVTVFIALAYEMLSKKMRKIRRKNKKAFWEMEVKFLKYAGGICVAQCVVTWVFKHNIVYTNSVGDELIRWITYIFAVMLIYVVCWMMPHMIWNMKDAPIRFCVSDPIQTTESYKDEGIAYIGRDNSLFIVNCDNTMELMSYEEENSVFVFYLGVIGDNCLVKAYGFGLVKEVYDCRYIIAKLLTGGYQKWFYDIQVKDWVSIPYKPTKEEKKKMKDLIKQKVRANELISKP